MHCSEHGAPRIVTQELTNSQIDVLRDGLGGGATGSSETVFDTCEEPVERRFVG